MQKKNKWLAFGAVALAVLVAVFALVFWLTRPDVQEGSKEITVRIQYDTVDKTVEIATDAKYLRAALEQENLIAGTESQYGLFILTVDGRTADDSKQEWWCVTKGGETVMTGVDTTPIADGDGFELVLKTGW